MINNRMILYSLFVVSSSTLCFEILATRITSVIFVNHFAFIIISLAILGLSLGAIFAHYYFDKRKPTSLVSSLTKNLIILSISYLVFFLFSSIDAIATNYFLYFATIIIPFFLSGIFYANVFKHFAHISYKIYGADLIGSATGSILAIVLITYLNPSNGILAISILLISVALSISISQYNKLYNVISFFITLSLLGFLSLNGQNSILKKIPIGEFAEKDFHFTYQNRNIQKIITDSRWSIYGRADLVEYNHQDVVRHLFIDGAAGTPMLRFDGNLNNQDPILSKLLLEKGYQIYGLVRRSSQFNTTRIDELISENQSSENFKLFFSDMTDPTSISSLINSIMPDEVYNLAAQSHVAVSFVNPLYTTEVSSLGTISILEAIKNSGKDIKFYQASSSEMYGGEVEEKLLESSEFNPKSPYAAAKLFSHNITKIYRESYGIFAVNAILFNHESPVRGETFVTRKISWAVGRINQEIQTKLTLGNLNAKRDWGFAGDYVEGMYSMLQFDKPEDWVLATGETHSVSEFCELAFSYFNLDWNEYVVTNKKYERPNEVKFLLGDYSKAKDLLGWKPKTSFKELVEMMVNSDNNLAKSEKLLIESGMLKPTWEYSSSI